eukprot:TRINITY_DN1104_c0_g2_i1.p1 TRINITY_DN1104_c0_g2~~TRINITY_DN1104_c0_g2_i1.p1  ORF type:complete len:447 (+),score=133.62 TRINITY_DN1104_c0_g2_i1:302-1642(+)
MRKRSMSLAGSPLGRNRSPSGESQAAKFMRKASRGFLPKSSTDDSPLERTDSGESEEEELEVSAGQQEMQTTLERMRSLGFLGSAEDEEEDATTSSGGVSENIVRMLAKYDIEEEGSDEEADKESTATLKKWKAKRVICTKYLIDDPLLMERTFASKDLALVKAIFSTVPPEYFDDIAQATVILFEANNTVNVLLQHLVQREIARAASSSSFRETIFREDTIASKVFSHYLKLVGQDYLTAVVKPFIIQLVSSPSTYVGSDSAVKRFMVLIETLLKRITLSTESMPPQIQSLCFYVEKEVRIRSPESVLTALGNLIFLRFINHSIVAPVGFKLLDEKPTPDGTRVLVTMAKVLQNVINGIAVSESSPLFKLNGLVHLYTDRVQHFLKTLPRWSTTTALSQGVRIQRDFALEQLQRYLRNHMEVIDSAYSSDTGGEHTGEESGECTE